MNCMYRHYEYFLASQLDDCDNSQNHAETQCKPYNISDAYCKSSVAYIITIQCNIRLSQIQTEKTQHQ